MRYVDLYMLLLFWTGVLILTIPEPGRLKARALRYLGRSAELAKGSLPARYIKSVRSNINRELMLGELSESLAYVKNVVVLGRGESISAELLLTELADASKKLAPAYTDMAHYLHMNEKLRAGEILGKLIPGSYARDIGSFLAGWEDVEQEELLPAVDMFQTALREERLTRQKKRDEFISDVIYLPVVANCMVVLLNFIYIAYFIPQRESLGLLF